jgi:hypothetical protein
MCRSILERIALAEFYALLLCAWATCSSCRLVADILLDLFRHCDERLLNIDGVFRRCFQEGYLKVTSELGALIRAHLSNFLHVAFVADEYFADSGIGKPLNFMHPLSHIIEGVAVSHIIHDDNAMRSSIVAACERAEPLLTCCVPLYRAK